MPPRPLTRFRTLSVIVFLLCTHAASSFGADWLYTFRAGDTLWDICKQYTHYSPCWRELGPRNNIDADRRIAPGTRIRIPASWLKVPAASADISFVRGDVRLALPGESATIAQSGMKLPIGAKVITGDGSASVVFADGSSITLEPHTELALDTLSNFERHGMVDSTVRLNRGTIKTRVLERAPRSRFQTITPSAVASVRGTEYRVNFTQASPNQTERKDATLVEVYAGLVDVGAQQKSYPVPAEFGIVSKQGEAPSPPVKLLPPPEFKPFETQQYLAFDAQSQHTAPLTLSWMPLQAATAYQLNVLAVSPHNDAPEQLLQGQRTATTQASLKGLPPGCYTLSLRAIDPLGLHGLAAKERICLNKQLAAPRLLAKSNTIVGGTQLDIGWDAVESASVYRVEVSQQAGFNTLLQQFSTAETSLQITHDSPVFVRVIAMNESGNLSMPSTPIRWQPALPQQTDWTFLIPIGLFLVGLILI